MTSAALQTGELQARKARDALGIAESAPIYDIVAVIERAGIPVFLLPLPGGIKGLAQRLDGHWYVAADSASRFAGPLRFTLAHEFGHVFMGHEPSLDDESTLDVFSGSETIEVNANYFAAEFLVPRALVHDSVRERRNPDWTALAFDLASETGATPWVTAIRMRTCGYLAGAEYRRVQQDINATVSTIAWDQRDDIARGAYSQTEARTPSDETAIRHAHLWID